MIKLDQNWPKTGCFDCFCLRPTGCAHSFLHPLGYAGEHYTSSIASPACQLVQGERTFLIFSFFPQFCPLFPGFSPFSFFILFFPIYCQCFSIKGEPLCSLAFVQAAPLHYTKQHNSKQEHICKSQLHTITPRPMLTSMISSSALTQWDIP